MDIPDDKTNLFSLLPRSWSPASTGWAQHTECSSLLGQTGIETALQKIL